MLLKKYTSIELQPNSTYEDPELEKVVTIFSESKDN